MSKTRVAALQEWFAARARDLPWRRDGDLYSIWLSEIMLQQTQVATVIPYYERFKAAFPSVGDLARASLDEVYALWAGLGYYSRARNLHRGAQAIAARLEAGQGFPASREEWLAIPGVGPYTAGAICSIGLGLREPIVDGNVVRVLSRLDAVAEIDAKASQIWSRARALVSEPAARPQVLNQALMELGATVCKPRAPLCSECPVRRTCRGRKEWERYPPKKARAEVRRVEEKRWIMVRVVSGGGDERGAEPAGAAARSGLRAARGAEAAGVENASVQKGGTGAAGKTAGGQNHRTSGESARGGSSEPRLEVLLIQNQGARWREGLWDFPATPPVESRRSAKLVGEFRSKYQVTIHKVQRDHQVLLVDSHARVSRGHWYDVNVLPGVPSPVKKAIAQLRLEEGRVVLVGFGAG